MDRRISIRNMVIVRGDPGVALLTVLVIMLAVAGSSASFVWFMNQQQTRAGVRYRSAAAMAAAEAGVHHALAVLESAGLHYGAIGRTGRPDSHTEVIRVGPLEGAFMASLSAGPDNPFSSQALGKSQGSSSDYGHVSTWHHRPCWPPCMGLASFDSRGR